MSSQAGTPPRGPASIEASVNYLRPMSERPWSDAVDQSKRNYEVDQTTVKIENAWPMADRLSLDKDGFIVRKHQTAVIDFHDETQLTKIYAREMEQMIKEMTGADLAMVLETPLTRFSGKSRIQPAYNVHMDFTFEGVAGRMKERGIDVSEPPYTGFKTIRVFQTWRALSGPGQGSALAFADPSSVKTEDLVEADFVRYIEGSAPGYNQFYLCNANPNHKWYYFPKLERDDLLVWTGIDLSNRAMLPMHTSIIDTTEAAAPPRDSVETRVFTFFRN